MCEMHELVRAFILRPHKLHKGGELLRDIVSEFETLQRGYDNSLEILFLKDGGFAVCMTSDFPTEDIEDATHYLADFLAVRGFTKSLILPRFLLQQS
jgi:hypothetical protein